MSKEDMLDLQWQPMMLGITKEERWEAARKEREKRQKEREETVVFLQSFIFCTFSGICVMAAMIIAAVL